MDAAPWRSRGWRLSLIGVLLLVILCGAYYAKYASRSAAVDSKVSETPPLELGRPRIALQAAWLYLSMRKSSLRF